MRFIHFIRANPIAILIIALPIAFVAEMLAWGEIWVFAFSAVGVIPMAHYIGKSTEILAHYTGPRVGGLLNATLGNAAELIITIFAIREGLLELVKASITGSILGNILVVLGMSMVIGGIRHGIQSFDRRQASNNAILLLLAVVALVIPSLLSHYIGVVEPEPSIRVEALSLSVALVMIILYSVGLIFSINIDSSPLVSDPSSEIAYELEPTWSIRRSLIILALSTAGVAYLSELLVSSVGPVVVGLGISEFFIGIILIPLIGNVAEHLVAVQVAARNKMELSVEISLASSIQIALFVAPVLVFISLLMGNPLTLVFNQFELLALVTGVLIAVFVAFDGESNWLEGASLLAVYVILVFAFFLLPV